jgi:lysophospholipase L1-like esterase
MKTSNWKRWLARWSLAIAVPLTIAELALQGAAYWLWRSERQVETLDATVERVVLCIGDSNTFGIGAGGQDKSYPAVLENLLAANSETTWQVVNAGWPGSNSSEVLHRAPALLNQYRPDYICILAGTNNRWNRALRDAPPPDLGVPADPQVQGWQWRWRTLRILQLLQRGSALQPAQLPIPREPEAPPETEVPLSASTRQALLAESKPLPDVDSPPLKPQEEQVSAQDPLWLRLDEVESFIESHRSKQATELLLPLLPQLRERQDLRTGIRGIRMLRNLDHTEAVAEEGEFYRSLYGALPQLALIVIRPLLKLGRVEEARQWVDQATVLQTPGEESARFYETRAAVVRAQGDRIGQILDALRALLLGLSEEEFRALLRPTAANRPDLIQTARLQFEALDLDEATCQRGVRALEALLAESEGIEHSTKTLRRDLVHLIQQVRHRNAVPVLLTYANYDQPPEISETLRSVAADLNEALVDVTPAFQGKPKEVLFSADLSHPNAKGYRVIAERVAERLLELDRR